MPKGATRLEPKAVQRPIPPEVLSKLAEHQVKEADRQKRLGAVRPIIHADFQGHKFVAVGNELHWSKTWKTFPHFLMDYIKKVLGYEWGQEQQRKPLEQRHPVMQWNHALGELQRHTKETQTPTADGLFESELDGPSKAYLLLSYDLYVLRDHTELQDLLLKRLRHTDQFQGARYEVFTAAAMIRAGFKLEFEDEGDVSKKHPEFIATHTRTGQVVAVEAKSRHRPGVLGRPGKLEVGADFKVGIHNLVKDALSKGTKYPFFIFVDANLPPEVTSPLAPRQWYEEVGQTVANADSGMTKGRIFVGSTFNLVAITNNPHHYGEPGKAMPAQGTGYFLKPNTVAVPLEHPEVIGEIETALKIYGNIPAEFPDGI